MSNKIKNYLGIAIIAVLVIFAFSAMKLVYSYDQSIEPSSFRSFSVSAEGKVVAIPDIAKFTYSIITQGGIEIADLQKETADKGNKVIEFIKSNGVEDEDIKTENYSVSPRYQYYNCNRNSNVCPPPEIVGYTVSQTVSVKVRDFDKIGVILAGVIKNGANSVSGLSFVIDDRDAVESEARAEAIKKAKEKAKAIAKAGRFSLGKLLAIQEGGTPRIFVGSVRTLSAEFESASVAPSIEPGSQDVIVNMTLTYEIK